MYNFFNVILIDATPVYCYDFHASTERKREVITIKSYTIIKNGYKVYDGPAISTQYCDLIQKTNEYNGAQPFILGDFEVYTRDVIRHYEIYSRNGRLISVYTSLANFARAVGIPVTRLQEVFRMMVENPDMEDDQGRHYVVYDVEMDGA